MAEIIRVLYVDDEPDLLDISRIFLEHTGDFSVETIDSASAALDLMKSEYFDAIISDYQMPGMDGIEFLKKVRNSGNTIPFILFTGKGREEVVIEALNEGADFYLQKGGDPTSQFVELAHKVRLAVSGKKAATALKKSEDKYRQLIEHANEAIVVAQDGMLKLVNQRAIEVTGYPEQELLSMPFTEIINPADRAMVMERYQRRLNGEELPSRYEFRLSSKEGDTCWVEISAVVIDWDGRPATLNFLSDVTGRKQADELLRISEEKYRKAFFTSPDSICITRLHDGMFVSVNKGFTEMSGYTEEDIAGKTSLEINIWKDPEDRRKIVEGLKAHGEVRDYEARFLTKTGEIYGVMSSSVIELNGVPHILNITRDITGRKKAEEALQTGVERYKTISEMTTDFVFSCTRPDGDTYSIDWMTGAVERITGYTIDELVALGCWRCLVLPEDALVFDENITNLPAGTSRTCILRIQTKLGDTRCLEVHTSNNASDPNRIFGSCRDISERKQMEDARLTNEDRLQMTQEIAHIGCWEYDMKTNLMWGSGEGRHIFGFPPVAGSSPIEEFTSCITEHELVLKAFNDLISEGKEYDLVFTINPKDGSAQRTLHSIGRLEKDEQGNPVKVRGINQDITERKQAEEALRESVKKYSTIYDQSPIAIELYDASGTLVNVNPACLELFGIENIQVIQNFSLFGDPNINDEQKKRLHQGETVQYQGPFDFEKVKAQKLYPTSREGVIWLDVLITPLENRVDSIMGFLVQIQNITERKRAELALAESEEVFREVFNNANDAIFLHELLPDGLPGQYFRVNDIACKRLGYSREELYNMSPRDIVSPQHSLKIPDIAAKLKSKGYATFEAIHQRKDGSTFPVEITTHIFTLQGRLVGLSIIRDTTERKKIEEALRTSEEKFRLMTTGSSDVIGILDLAGKIQYMSNNVIDISGFQPGEYEGTTAFEFVYPDDRKEIEALFEQVIRETAKSLMKEFRISRKDGGWAWVEVLGTNYLDNPTVNGIVVNFRNISERKRMELELKTALESLKEAHRLAHIGTFEWEMETDTVTWSDELFNIAGRDPTLPAPTFATQSCLYTPASWDRLCSSVTKALTTEEPFNIELEFIRPDGSIRWTNTHGGVKRDPKGKVIGFHGTVQDITERKMAEEALRESEEKYRLLVKNSHDIIYTISREGVFTFVSEGWTELLGQPVTDMMGKQFQQFIHPDDIAKCQTFMQRVLETGQRQTGVEYRVKHANGSWRWHTTNAVPLRDRAGIIVGGEGNARDITEQKQTEEALTDSEVFNRGLVENLPDYVLVYGPEGKVLYVNPATEKAFGYSVEELIGTSLLSYIAEEHREEVTLRMKARHEGREVPVSEIDIVARDGHRRSVIIKGTSIRYHGSPATLILLADITERKELEKEREYHEQELMEFSTSLATANKKLNLLSGITRHDINNQLTVLMGFLTILEKQLPGTSFNDHFQKVSTAAKRISAMIQFTKEYEEIGVHASFWQDCRTLVDTAAKQAPLGKVKVKNDLQTGTEVFADPLVVKVFYNLMDNAVRYGGKITTIRFSALESGDDHFIVCEDDGDGVPAAEKEKIFERGFGKNTGLGLALSREILYITGITIRETGEPGKGARFEITVPDGICRKSFSK